MMTRVTALCSVQRRTVCPTLLCANLAIRCYEPSYTESFHGCSQEVQ